VKCVAFILDYGIYMKYASVIGDIDRACTAARYYSMWFIGIEVEEALF